MEEQTDATLVAQARAGDNEAFGRLIERYQPLAARLAARLVGEADLARDLVQEALLQAYLALARLRDPARFRSWLYGIVLNVCRSHLRDRPAPPLSLETLAGGLRFEARPFADDDPDPQDVVEARELHGRVLAAVEVLPPKIRAATLLFYYEQLSLQEIAAILGVSVVAVKSRLHQARKQLRAHLLPGYPEMANGLQRERRKLPMIPVTIADVIARGTPPERRYVVILHDAAGRRLVPIWVGPAEGTAIAIGVRNLPTDRPLTYPFIASLLSALGGTLDSVEITALKEDTFYAAVHVRTNGTTHAVDARPSDALALAARTGSPIAIAPDVLDRCGIALPADFAPDALGRGAARIAEEMDAQFRTLRATLPRAPEDQAHMHQEFLAFLASGDE